MSALQKFSIQHLPKVTAVLENFFASQLTAAQKLTPHFSHSIEMIRDFSLCGGKMVRPLLVVLGYQLAGGSEVDFNVSIYQVAAGVELFHRYLLNLDDMADRDEMRYGYPTIWKSYEKQFHNWDDVSHHARTFAEIDGMLLNSFVTELIRTADFPPDRLLEVLEVVDKVMCQETISGWQLHYFQNQVPLSQASEAEYLKGAQLVTAEYTFVAPLLIGVTLALKNDDENKIQLTKSLSDFGRAVGTAFQLKDDILGLFGNPAETGKPVGNDVREGKKTILLQKAYSLSSTNDKNFLEKVCGSQITPIELEKIQNIVKKTGALAATEQLINDLVKTGANVISSLQKSVEQMRYSLELQVLCELDEFVKQRKN